MSRQFSTPVLVNPGNQELTPLGKVEFADQDDANTEDFIQRLVHETPGILPIGEIDVAFVGAIPICRELNTPAGPIDNFLVTPAGLPVLVECKLWRNPQARREVVGQILDYSKELSRFTSADIEREAARRGVPSVVEAVRATGAQVDEAEFHDALSTNLRKGRCLLLIVGDGIREGVEAIFDHLREHSVLHFSLGLVELPMFSLPNGERLVTPRVLARTAVEVRHVIDLPESVTLAEATQGRENGSDPEMNALGDERLAFWKEFLSELQLDDPDQPIPSAGKRGDISFLLPEPGGNSWITVYRDIRNGEVGLFLSFSKNSPGEVVSGELVDRFEGELKEALGGNVQLFERNGKTRIRDRFQAGDLQDPDVRRLAFDWLRERANTFVNVLRPAVRAAVADIQDLSD